MQTWLNTLVPSYTIAASTSKPSDVIIDLATTYGNFWALFGDAQDIYYMAAKTYTNVTVGEIINEALICGLGAITTGISNPSGNVYLAYRSEYQIGYLLNQSAFKYFDTTHSTSSDHICMSDLVMSGDSRNLPNEITATITTGAQYTRRNQDAYDLYGAISLQQEVQISDATGIGLWLDRLDLSSKLRSVKSLEFPAIRRDGLLQTWVGNGGLITTVQVTYDINNISFTDKYLVTRQRHLITPESWAITLELWRGI
jgi:hypothetical protein